jgi:hypothetical protein
LAFEDATWARRGATRAFLGASGFSATAAVAWAVCSFSVVDIVISHSPFAVITAFTTWIALVGNRSKRIVRKQGDGEGIAMGRQMPDDDR